MQAAKPKVNGLVLAGGKSVRMGSDKNLLNWHGKEQQYYLIDLLQEFCEEVFISCRLEQETSIPEPYLSLPDTFTGLGPMGATLSAFRQNPDAAWLVLACDLPLVNSETLAFLIGNRNSSRFATAFENPENGFPEPLLTLWEPKSYPVLLSFLAQGYSCPRKVLINSEVQILQVPDQDVLKNVNTPEEREQVLRLLKQRKETV
ncbi:NTP transferase domain-containing protein [Adhaeribacter soli]|uniref:Probable molybdenum cofactor guanylyltransferase n=2 Tax=Adhaeribacter soli TaxID=2607655 RepID=A0A5N1J6A0_9BACT|nr:NTP transferase domain-containing protein [Adhaeribacter soli]